MADAPEIRYARASDGSYIAYQVLGDGEPTLVSFNGSMLVSIEAIDEEPRWAAFDRRLAAIGRLIRFDSRGMGLSDSVGAVQNVENWMADVLTLLDLLGTERAVLVASATGVLPSIRLAAERSDRVASLVLMNGYARTIRADDYPIGIPAHVIERYLAEATRPDATAFDDMAFTAPSLMGDERTRDWWRRSGHRAVGPATAQGMLRTGVTADVRDRLDQITVPTLVIHRRDNRFVRVELGRYLAEHIPGARYVELAGRDHIPWAGDGDAILTEIESFLGASSGAGLERRVATVLFTDVVGSTELASKLGDRRWRERLDRHDRAVRGEVERHGGRVVKFTGDGVLAEFGSPSQAVAAGREVVRAVDLEIRVGLHSGEVDVRGGDLGGLAVNLAARVCARAAPGEVLATRTVVDLVAGSALQFTDRGEHDLKGVPGPWRLFAVEPAPTGSPGG
jgi:class 3 adenylate cyclase